MRKFLLLIFLISTCLSLNAQFRYRSFIVSHGIINTGNTFYGNSKSVAIPDLTGTHEIKPLISLFDGYTSRGQYKGLQNLGRKFNLAYYFEYIKNDDWSFTTGFELGARGYEIQAEQSNINLLISYRNLSIPFFVTHSTHFGYFWSFRKFAGMAINQSRTSSYFSAQVMENKALTKLYPTLIFGLEIANLNMRGPFSYEISYQQGFYNLVNDNYLGIDYTKGIKINSNGSHVRIGVKWNLGEKFIKGKIRKPTKAEAEKENQERLEIYYREVKTPVEFRVKSNKLKVCFRDDQTIDGDSIDVEFNKIIAAENIRLVREYECVQINLSDNLDNILVIHAVNEGRIPPNTYEILVFDGFSERKIELKSDLKSSAAIKFVWDSASNP